MKPIHVLLFLLYAASIVSAFSWFGYNNAVDRRDLFETNAQCSAHCMAYVHQTCFNKDTGTTRQITPCGGSMILCFLCICDWCDNCKSNECSGPVIDSAPEATSAFASGTVCSSTTTPTATAL